MCICVCVRESSWCWNWVWLCMFYPTDIVVYLFQLTPFDRCVRVCVCVLGVCPFLGKTCCVLVCETGVIIISDGCCVVVILGPSLRRVDCLLLRVHFVLNSCVCIV